MKILYTPQATKEFLKLDKPVQKKIKSYMEEVSQLENPPVRGKALVGNISGLWRYRVMDYRILCRIEDDKLIITVVSVGHRKEIY